ncbi:hypothetical protein H4R34_001254 [Dimargaris verticillata]|uniref:Small ribosomal subunit protein mS41 n=1 Tax=Dimargaris verticillata TaxID=2761393 RepID=A0A9W8EB33_9FUNG|nr:hypothetical protein H4R34_001254 [Dimargaris verticillata]
MTTEKFLKTIGRECEKYTDKFESWDVLFTATSSDMRHKLSIPTHQRKWILDWTEKYRQGIDPYYIRPSRKKKN